MTIKGQSFPAKQDNKPSETDSDPSSFLPARFKGDANREALWIFLCTDLQRRGQWSETYSIIVDQLVEAAAQRVTALESVKKHGQTIPTYGKNGKRNGFKANPSFDQYMKLEVLVIKLLEKLGMTPRDIRYLDPDGPEEVMPAESQKDGVVYFR